MKAVFIKVSYATSWGQSVKISGWIPELGDWDVERSPTLSYIDSSTWGIYLKVPQKLETVAFRFLVTQNDHIVDQERGTMHSIKLPLHADMTIDCIWEKESNQKYFNTSVFTSSIFKHRYHNLKMDDKNKVYFLVSCNHIEATQELVISGDKNQLGAWDENKVIPLKPCEYGKWYVGLNKEIFDDFATYKFAIRDAETKKIIEWEEDANRGLKVDNSDSISAYEQVYHKTWVDWRASGVAIPIFSLRSDKSFGIGEFLDLKLLVDWSVKAKLRFIQVLPINDTTSTYSWIDSYPYNAISIYALHPIYLSLHPYVLKNKVKNKQFRERALELNKLETVDYDKVITLKTEYIKELYNDIGQEILLSPEYQNFYKSNQEWLFPYACFCHLRDLYKTTHLHDWGEFSRYDFFKLKDYVSSNSKMKGDVDLACFTQFLLHSQLSEMKAYANNRGVVLKGDIPIGVSPNSVEVWTEPDLFNLDSQTGAPPDDFSIDGQNWGFPTYNWSEMRKDNYKWWTNRFTKMSDYFDAYRIDHILGFFRIWEIPKTSITGLLGYFSPALPLSAEEIRGWGIQFDESLLVPMMKKEDLAQIFGEYTKEVLAEFFTSDGNGYLLKDTYDNQAKIRYYFEGKNDRKSQFIRDGLFQFCTEVLFIRDKYQQDKFHPRVFLHKSVRFERLEEYNRSRLYDLHQYYFFSRHSSFWKDEALNKLPTLIDATDMLVCGEDLGMVPESVPEVMHQLQILSLEIQRMPKELGVSFSNLSQLPYLSVATTSTHDMSPLRMWWDEDKDIAQKYYTNILHLKGNAPKECNALLASKIIEDHLQSPAMLAILPLQDWLSVSDKLRRKDAEEERINVPSDPKNNWNYRMHITLEQLLQEKDFSDTLYMLNEASGR